MSSTRLQNKKVAIIATNGFEQSELLEPKQSLEHQGATVDVISIDGNTSIKGWDEKDWGKAVDVDKQIEDAVLSDYQGIVLPGGQMNPDILRMNNEVIEFLKAGHEAENIAVIAAICHAPWLLIEANLVADKQIASFPSIRTDVVNAGANWNDKPVMADGKLVTSRNPDDIPMFVEKICEKLTEQS